MMNDLLPLLIAVLMFPLAFAYRHVRARRGAFVLPLLLAAPFVAGAVLGWSPRYAHAFFAVLAVGIAIRWQTMRAPTN